MGRNVFILCLLVLACAGLSACNTAEGFGRDLSGASDDNEQRLTRLEGDPTFTKLNADIQRLQRVTSHVNLLLNVSGQWANGPLLSSEEFGIGGMFVGRGYDPSEITGDEGVSGKAELQWNEPYKILAAAADERVLDLRA